MAHRHQSRRILPAPLGSHPISPIIPPDEIPAASRSVRSQSINVACNNCRTKKSKCDGNRPTCANCTNKGVQCAYAGPEDEPRSASLKRANAALRSANADLEELFELLRSAPEAVAMEAFARIRAKESPRVVLEFVSGSARNMSPSPHLTARGALPPLMSSLEFELIATYPRIYAPFTPLEASNVDLGLLGVPVHGGFLPKKSSKSISDATNVYESHAHGEDLPQTFAADHGTGSDAQKEKTMDPSTLSPGLRSLPTAGRYIDSRLALLDISRWTDVPMNSHSAAEAISLYLVNDHPLLGFFDANLFLDDLITGNTRFCSKLLVNALLGWACHSYTGIDPTSALLVRKFLDEARILLEIDGLESLTSISGAMYLALSNHILGNDRLGIQYLEKVKTAVTRLGLIDAPDDGQPIPTTEVEDEDFKAAKSYTAWSIFNFFTIHSMNYHAPPFIISPPTLPIPGYVKTSEKINKIIWRPLPDYMEYYVLDADITLPKAESIYRKLLSWADSLPNELSRREENTHHEFTMHIWYHTTIIDLFRPLFEYPPQERLLTFSAFDSHPVTVFSASIKQLKYLIYNFRSRFHDPTFSILWQSGMLYLINAFLRDCSQTEAQFYFHLCMRGYQRLASCVPIVRGIVLSILNIAVKSDVMLPAHAQNLFVEVMQESAKRFTTGKQKYMSLYPIDHVVAVKDLKAATLEVLAQEFEDLMLSNEDETSMSTNIWRLETSKDVVFTEPGNLSTSG